MILIELGDEIEINPLNSVIWNNLFSPINWKRKNSSCGLPLETEFISVCRVSKLIK